MNSREIVKTVMEKTGTGNSDLAGRLKISREALWDRLNNKRVKSDLSVTLLCDMLRVMDYKVIIAPRTSKLSPGEYEIE